MSLCKVTINTSACIIIHAKNIARIKINEEHFTLKPNYQHIISAGDKRKYKIVFDDSDATLSILKP